MSDLFSSLSLAVRSLLAEQGAIEVTSNNVANVNTPGYSRQEAIFSETPPLQAGNLQFGTGVELAAISSDRDNILNIRLSQETQQQGKFDSLVNGLQQIQALFNPAAGTGLGANINAFFDSFQQLSTNPTDPTLRQGVLIAAGNLAASFRQIASGLGTQQQSLDQSVVQQVGKINNLTAQIASLNVQVAAAQTGTQSGNTLLDERTQLIQQLSQMIDVQTIDAGNGNVTLTTTQGVALVVGAQSFNLQIQTNPATGFQDVYAQGSDVTSSIQAGSLGATIQLRDQEIPSLLSKLDTLASGIATAVNTRNQAGFDLSGAAGGNIFVPPAPGPGAARNLAVAITDPSKIAASSDGTIGSNGNAVALADLANQNIAGGLTPAQFNAGLVGQVGSDTAAAQSQQQSAGLLVQQLQDQQGAISGVSLDEEAANLVRYQTAFDASARVVTVIDQLTQTVLSMGAGA
jgi:flagellar hook-associated protein 1 FlgK